MNSMCSFLNCKRLLQASFTGTAMAVIAALAMVALPASWALADLVGYWSFDAVDGSGDFLDVSGRGNTAVRQSNTAGPLPGTTAGVYGNAVQFDATNQQYLRIADSPELRLTENFSIGMWFQTASTSQSQKYLWGPNSYAIIYEYQPDQVQMYSIGQSGSHPQSGSNLTISNTNWHHLVYTKQGDDYRGYLDGQQIFDIDRTFAFDGAAVDRYMGAANPTSNHVGGNMDDVAVWDEGLSGMQVKALAAGITTPLQAADRVDGVTYNYGSNYAAQPRPQYADASGSELVDAEIPGGWGSVGFQDSTGPSGDDGFAQPRIEFTLPEVTLLDAVLVDYGVGQGAGIHAPDSVDVSYYADAGFTTLLGTVTSTDFVNVDGVHQLTFDLPDQYVQYVRLDFYNDLEWTFLSEVTFLEKVPEPGTLALALLAVPGLFWRRRRR